MAFSFDVWKSKLTLLEAVKIAKQENIPLHKGSLSVIGKEFNERYLCLDKYPKNRLFKYSTTLLNKKATVSLYFSLTSKKLYNLKIHWITSDKKFIDVVYNLLDKKYGKRERFSTISDFIFFKKYQWKPNKYTRILTKSSPAGIEISYEDIEESQNNDKEKKIVKIEKEEKALIKDGYKF
jgi:hypothetical protein